MRLKFAWNRAGKLPQAGVLQAMRAAGGLVLGVMLLSAGWGSARGQQAAAPATQATASGGVTQTAPTVEKPNPLKRRMTDKEKITQQKNLKEELKGHYKTWVEQDVRWIITDTELQAFKQLTNDEERDQFDRELLAAAQPQPG
jgi:hypothetical protein